MLLRKIFTILIYAGFAFIRFSDGFSIPDEVEIFNGYRPESSWGIASEPKDKNLAGTLSFVDNSIKAIRNRRDLKYHIKSVPQADILFKEPMFKDIPRHFIKRDIEHVTDMDVSAQYTEQLAIDRINPKSKREVIEEEDVKNGNARSTSITGDNGKVWIPQPSPDDEDFFASIDANKKQENETVKAPTAEALTEKQNGRGARGLATDQWIKLPFLPPRIDNDKLTASGPTSDEINHRMPRVNFVTQGKGLQAAESRNQRESIPRSSSSRSSDLRTDIYPSRDNRARSLDYSSYSRRNYYSPEDYRRTSYDDYYDDSYYSPRRDPYYDQRYDYKNSRRYDYNDYGRTRDPYDRYDSYEDSYYRSDRSDRYDRPRRIIYYANLPDVNRSPPNVYRNPYSRYDDDRYYGRGSTYPSNRYPYSALKKAEDGPRDLSVSSTANKDKADAQKRQEELRKAKAEATRRDSSLNSHQYPINNHDSDKGQHQTLYHDITRMDSDLHRYEHPSFQAIDDPYVNRRD